MESDRCRGRGRRVEVTGKGWEIQSATLAELPLLSWGWIKGVAGEGVETTLAAENSHQPTATKEVGSTVLRPPAAQFYKQNEWSWKAVHPQNLNKDAHLMLSSSQPWETRVENKPCQTEPDLQNHVSTLYWPAWRTWLSLLRILERNERMWLVWDKKLSNYTKVHLF